MKLEIDNLDKTYRLCTSTGKLNEKTIDFELIASLKAVAEKSLEFVRKISTTIPKESTDWTFVFRDYYESLRNLIEAIMLFDGIAAENHQCKNAYVCFKHPELVLNWNFLETVRLRRNAINYRGQLLIFKEWDQYRLQFDLHINLLKLELDKRLDK